MVKTLAEQLSEDDMIKLVEAGPLHNAQEVADFLNCSEGERLLIITSYKSSGILPVRNAWDKFLSVANSILPLANIVSAIAGAVTGVYGVATL